MKFSILLPTKDRLDLLKYAIETVRRQTFADWEIIIADTASAEDIGSDVQSLGDPRIRYVRSATPLPVTDNWNVALEHSSGDYVVMLGDDDGLLRDHLSVVAHCIEQLGEPELVLTDAILYAYPKVFPGHESGFLQIAYGAFFDGRKEPYLLERRAALDAVRAALSFRVAYQFNMQYSVISRELIKRARKYGPYFQSPYPDFYASNVNLLLASRVAVIPRPLVCIGISPKSYGFYYFNQKREEGERFLDNMTETDAWKRVRCHLLPGNVLFTCWLVAVDTVRTNWSTLLASTADLSVAYGRYRLIQLWHVAKFGKRSELRELYSHTRGTERFTFRAIGALLYIASRLPKSRLARWITRHLDRRLSPYPDRDTRVRDVRARNMLEVFETISPEYY